MPKPGCGLESECGTENFSHAYARISCTPLFQILDPPLIIESISCKRYHCHQGWGGGGGGGGGGGVHSPFPVKILNASKVSGGVVTNFFSQPNSLIPSCSYSAFSIEFFDELLCNLYSKDILSFYKP